MAGIGLFNFEVDGKAVTPIAIVAVASVAGIYLWRRQQSAPAAAQADPAAVVNAYRLGLLSSVSNAGRAVSNAGQNNAGASDPAHASGSSVAGGSPAGGV